MRNVTLRAIAIIVTGCAGVTPADEANRQVSLTGRELRETEECEARGVACGEIPADRVHWKAVRLFACSDAAVSVRPRPDVDDATLGVNHGRDFRAWWRAGEIVRVRDPSDRGEVFEARGCGQVGMFTCFRAHVVMRTPEARYDNPADVSCVRWAPWDPRP